MELLRKKEAAALLGVSIPTFDRLRLLGDFPRPVLLGTIKKWKPEELTEWAMRRRGAK